jgi:alkylation response protein AidB-like acyl-CoA dehydrogenase
MDVRLSAEQEALRDSARQMVGRLGPTTVADLADGERAAKLDAAIDAAGWRELRSLGDDGAPWASGVEVALLAEELGRGLADASFLGPILAADLHRVAGAGGDDGSRPPAGQRAGTGGERMTVALRADLGAPGAAVAIDAAGATKALSIDGTDVVELDIAGMAPGPDLTRPLAKVANPTAIGSATPAAILRWTALGLTLTAADLVGVMRGAIELGTAYAAQRCQYGAPVGSFQAVQHLLADAHVAMEGASSITLHAAWAADALSAEDALAAAAGAKAYTARAARTACETAIQVHGGIGHTWDCLAHVYLRRALASIDTLGGVGPNLERVLAHRGVHGLR